MFSRFLLPIVAAAAVFAQMQPAHTPPDPATMATMRVNHLASVLNLTDAQKTSAIGIFTTAYTSEQTIHTNMQTNRTSLAAAIKANDTATIDKVSATLGTLSGQITAIESKADAAFYSLLTAEQKTLYDAMPHGGPGGRGGPGGGMMMRGPRG